MVYDYSLSYAPPAAEGDIERLFATVRRTGQCLNVVTSQLHHHLGKLIMQEFDWEFDGNTMDMMAI